MLWSTPNSSILAVLAPTCPLRPVDLELSDDNVHECIERVIGEGGMVIAVLDQCSNPTQQYPHLQCAPISTPLPLISIIEACSSKALAVPWVLAQQRPFPEAWPTRMNRPSPVLRSSFCKSTTPVWHTGCALPVDDRTKARRPVDLNADFYQIWQPQQERQHDVLTPRRSTKTKTKAGRKNWNTIWEWWDNINDRVHLVGDKPIKKIHSIRCVQASVLKTGAWIYVLWCKTDGRVYIGQTGRGGSSCTLGQRAAEHVRAGADFLRLWNGTTLRLPSNIYR